MPVKCHTTVSLMDAKTYKGIVNMDFTVFPLMLREENLGKLQYDEMVGVPQTTAACVEHIS